VVTFVDTSAIFALVDRSDPAHRPAAAAFRRFTPGSLVTHRYVVVEVSALARRRLGAGGIAHIFDELLPSMTIAPVDDSVHEAALAEFRASEGAGPSLVDRTSFAFMRARGIDTAFAVDRDFRIAGFNVIPELTD
jgi:predicted nucleic acid-binding protein